MAGALRKTMVYLGLAEDEGRYYDEAYDDYEADEVYEAEEPREAREHAAEVTPLSQRRSVAQVVRTPEASGMSRITTIHPRTYNEAKTIGENFRDGTPVIMNLTDMDDADAKRLVDFAAGLVFGLHGAIERVTAKVFLLSPSTVEVHSEESTAAPGRTLFNQS
ncbi:cell division protein SepF [Knoellia subterranea]|uniref:Cell division protein SepF n=1 Tax=Knoellia subterranea KCTC 19937 TaxID=1385521 RepID=A0A0A0JQU1_9MICO|nr:cell division protein SepF [Knoellia subterranea]KGN38412.1 cell division protein SepF [Knoellia subterranea KCTC 19937]